MTDKQKNQIAVYRGQGLGYSVIARMMGLSVNTIKAHCRRNGLGGKRALEDHSDITVYACENCGKPVQQNKGRKKKRFCCDRCRNTWWNAHLELVNRKANYECTCKKCGKNFISYGNKDRKYCCHECYIEDRFGGEC